MIAAPPQPHLPAYLRWAVFAGVLALFLTLGLIPDVRAFAHAGYAALRSPDPAVMQAFVGSLGWAGPLALMAAFVLQAVLPVIPALVMIAVTARAYGPVEGFLIVYTGTVLGAVAGYWLGRTVGNSLIRLLIGESARRKTYEFAERNGAQGVLMVRLMPVLSADAMNLVAGAARMPFRQFMLASAAGALPVTALVVWLSGDNARLMWGLGGLSAVVALLALGRWWYTRHTRQA
ncbi:TVP38/TMEM64 family protein [Deinococcus cavernae]|uniref:TVP38/TMEM64 family membrane protein n=1 Tax=Deinococcus cavernae TaxID=2320857 RepID=A0A418V9A8_9DEIO|nr:TVP38/TMEM64 family protein [Deinococcus cavernae]RJF72708.1 TVP38/TMEM64 family protein [Deinococcus cavernae]